MSSISEFLILNRTACSPDHVATNQSAIDDTGDSNNKPPESSACHVPVGESTVQAQQMVESICEAAGDDGLNVGISSLDHVAADQSTIEHVDDTGDRQSNNEPSESSPGHVPVAESTVQASASLDSVQETANDDELSEGISCMPKLQENDDIEIEFSDSEASSNGFQDALPIVLDSASQFPVGESTVQSSAAVERICEAATDDGLNVGISSLSHVAADVEHVDDTGDRQSNNEPSESSPGHVPVAESTVQASAPLDSVQETANDDELSEGISCMPKLQENDDLEIEFSDSEASSSGIQDAVIASVLDSASPSKHKKTFATSNVASTKVAVSLSDSITCTEASNEQQHLTALMSAATCMIDVNTCTGAWDTDNAISWDDIYRTSLSLECSSDMEEQHHTGLQSVPNSEGSLQVGCDTNGHIDGDCSISSTVTKSCSTLVEMSSSKSEGDGDTKSDGMHRAVEEHEQVISVEDDAETCTLEPIIDAASPEKNDHELHKTDDDALEVQHEDMTADSNTWETETSGACGEELHVDLITPAFGAKEAVNSLSSEDVGSAGGGTTSMQESSASTVIVITSNSTAIASNNANGACTEELNVDVNLSTVSAKDTVNSSGNEVAGLLAGRETMTTQESSASSVIVLTSSASTIANSTNEVQAPRKLHSETECQPSVSGIRDSSQLTQSTVPASGSVSSLVTTILPSDTSAAFAASVATPMIKYQVSSYMMQSLAEANNNYRPAAALAMGVGKNLVTEYIFQDIVAHENKWIDEFNGEKEKIERIKIAHKYLSIKNEVYLQRSCHKCQCGYLAMSLRDLEQHQLSGSTRLDGRGVATCNCLISCCYCNTSTRYNVRTFCMHMKDVHNLTARVYLPAVGQCPYCPCPRYTDRTKMAYHITRCRALFKPNLNQFLAPTVFDMPLFHRVPSTRSGHVPVVRQIHRSPVAANVRAAILARVPNTAVSQKPVPVALFHSGNVVRGHRVCVPGVATAINTVSSSTVPTYDGNRALVIPTRNVSCSNYAVGGQIPSVARLPVVPAGTLVSLGSIKPAVYNTSGTGILQAPVQMSRMGNPGLLPVYRMNSNASAVSVAQNSLPKEVVDLLLSDARKKLVSANSTSLSVVPKNKVYSVPPSMSPKVLVELLDVSVCEVCGCVFARPLLLLQHMHKAHGIAVAEKDFLEDRSHKPVQCMFCSQQFYSKQGMTRHLRIVHEVMSKEYSCPRCSETDITDIIDHFRCKHNMPLRYMIEWRVCYLCRLNFNTISEVEEHIVSQHKDLFPSLRNFKLAVQVSVRNRNVSCLLPQNSDAMSSNNKTACVAVPDPPPRMSRKRRHSASEVFEDRSDTNERSSAKRRKCNNAAAGNEAVTTTSDETRTKLQKTTNSSVEPIVVLEPPLQVNSRQHTTASKVPRDSSNLNAKHSIKRRKSSDVASETRAAVKKFTNAPPECVVLLEKSLKSTLKMDRKRRNSLPEVSQSRSDLSAKNSVKRCKTSNTTGEKAPASAAATGTKATAKKLAQVVVKKSVSSANRTQCHSLSKPSPGGGETKAKILAKKQGTDRVTDARKSKADVKITATKPGAKNRPDTNEAMLRTRRSSIDASDGLAAKVKTVRSKLPTESNNARQQPVSSGMLKSSSSKAISVSSLNCAVFLPRMNESGKNSKKTDTEPKATPVTKVDEPISQSSSKEPSTVKDKNIYSCSLCIKNFGYWMSYRQHFKSVHGIDMKQCPLCATPLPAGVLMVQHISEKHLAKGSVVLHRVDKDRNTKSRSGKLSTSVLSRGSVSRSRLSKH